MDEHQLVRLATELSQENYKHDGSPSSPDGSNAANAKRKADDGPAQPQQRSKRNRYISIACNECKRRKIKCNGQTPCQRCGNLQLDCVYTPNCCSGFKDSLEYRDMTTQISSLQEQVNALFHELNDVCAQLGRGAPRLSDQPAGTAQTATPATSVPTSQSTQQAAINPTLQVADPYRSTRPHVFANGSPRDENPTRSPTSMRTRRQSSNYPPTFRGPTSDAFNFGVAKSSLQTMGISPSGDGQDTSLAGTREASLSPLPNGRDSKQMFPGVFHADKDPIWAVSLEEAERLCQVYEDEVGVMYPVLDIQKVKVYARKLYWFMEAAHRSGLVQQGLAGSDTIDDDETNVLKLVLATALTTEASGKSDLGERMFAYVQPAIDTLLLGSVGIKGVQMLSLAAMCEFHRDNEGNSWRLIGLTARLCIELGLHRRETYEEIQDEAERSETILLFWAIYVLDRRWSFGTGMPFALQDSDLDPQLPKPNNQSPYLVAMIQYSAIGSKVWRTVSAAQRSAGVPLPNVEEFSYLDWQVIQWHRNLPVQLRFEHPSQSDGSKTLSSKSDSERATHRLCTLLYLRANQMRILIYRSVLHSATSIVQNREQAQTAVDVAKDSIRVLTHINQTSGVYRAQQVLFNAFLTSALAVLFLAVSHAPANFAEDVREEFYMALELVRGFSSGSWVGKRLWKTIRVLKEFAPKLGLAAKDSSATPQTVQQNSGVQKGDLDPSRSAAVAMAGLAGHNVDEMALLSNGGSQAWSAARGANTSPSGMADDLVNLFEAVGGYAGIGDGGLGDAHMYGALSGSGSGVELLGLGPDDGLSHIFRDLF